MKLGTIRPDGSLLLHDENIKFRDEMTGRYQRINLNVRQKGFLGEQGYTVVSSSFISGIQVKDNNLYIRFHNGSVYVYYGFANHYDNMMRSISKGQYFNRRIRPTLRYEKLDSLPFPDNVGISPLEISDYAMFEAIDIDYIKKVAQNLIGSDIYAVDKVIKGIDYTEYKIDDLIILRPRITSQ